MNLTNKNLNEIESYSKANFSNKTIKESYAHFRIKCIISAFTAFLSKYNLTIRKGQLVETKSLELELQRIKLLEKEVNKLKHEANYLYMILLFLAFIRRI